MPPDTTVSTDEVVYEPSRAFVESTNVWRFMQEHGISDYDELIERTTTEVLVDLHDGGLSEEKMDELSNLLFTADLVKFARIFPSSEEANGMIPRALRFVEQTRPRPQPSGEPAEAQVVEMGA